MLPMMAGWSLAATFSGQVISHTGRYRHFPIAGAICATAGMALLATMNAGTTWPVASLYMFVLGTGIGLAVQVMVLVVQNSAPYRDLGAATSSVVLFRQAGSSIGVSLTGTLFTTRLAGQIVGLPGATANVLRGRVSSSTVIHLPAGLRHQFTHAFGDALPPVYGYLAPLLAVAVALAIALPEKPLRWRAHLAAD
jgi:hypothetical protein